VFDRKATRSSEQLLGVAAQHATDINGSTGLRSALTLQVPGEKIVERIVVRTVWIEVVRHLTSCET
jgi:hypothetical protein